MHKNPLCTTMLQKITFLQDTFPACIHVRVNKLFSCYVPVQYNIIIPTSSTNSLDTILSCTHYKMLLMCMCIWEKVRGAYRSDQLSTAAFTPSLSALPISMHVCRCSMIFLVVSRLWWLTLTIPLCHHREWERDGEMRCSARVMSGLQPHSVCLCSSAQKWTDGVERTWQRQKIQTTNTVQCKTINM